MAASIQSPDEQGDSWMAEINTTPLVDVMLVLLIIFLLTIPVVSASVQVQLPVQAAAQQDTSGDYVIVSIEANGALFLNDQPVDSVEALRLILLPAMAREPKPALHVRADGAAPYARIGPIIDMAQGLGLAQVSLLTEPPAQRVPAGAAQGRVGELAP
jgi:biopolymer transport protein ExbD